MKPIFYLIILLSGMLFSHAEMRQWTSSTGQEMLAELVSYDTESATLTIRKENNKTFTLPLDRLSEADQKWIADRQLEIQKELDKEKAALAKKRAQEKARIARLNKNAGKTISMKSTGKYPTSFHVYYPKSFDVSKKHPMIILFSPSGSGKGMLKNIRRGCDALGWIAIGCDTFRNGGKEKELERRFKELLPYMEAKVPHDPDALYLGGMSGGALRAYRYSGEFDRPWRGLLAYGGWLGSEEDMAEPARKMRVAIVNGDGDDNANNYVDRDMDILEGESCKVEYFSFSGGHKIAPPNVTEEAMRWMAK